MAEDTREQDEGAASPQPNSLGGLGDASRRHQPVHRGAQEMMEGPDTAGILDDGGILELDGADVVGGRGPRGGRPSR